MNIDIDESIARRQGQRSNIVNWPAGCARAIRTQKFSIGQRARGQHAVHINAAGGKSKQKDDYESVGAGTSAVKMRLSYADPIIDF